MRVLARWVVGCSLWVPVFLACGSKNGGFAPQGVVEEGGSPNSDDGAASSSGISLGDGSSGPLTLPDGTIMTGNSMCKGGHYDGSFDGNYSSHLTLIGLSIPVTGNVSLDLYQAGNPGMTCMLNGESLDCSTVFTLQNGTITGVANGNDAGGGFPYFCTMTGTLDCAKKKLVNGWIQCTYCVGPLNDGGMSCAAFGGGGLTGLGGQFAGVLTADYDYGTTAFVNGSWNGAEALAGNDGGSPGPDGGKPTDYLNFTDGGYGVGDFGGSGHWNATHK